MDKTSQPRPPLRRGRRRTVGLIALGAVAVVAALVVSERAMEASLVRADPDALSADAALDRFAINHGAGVYRARCAGCHGREGQGDPKKGVPNLVDQDWLYGSGAVSDIERVIDYGIRARNPRTWNLALMPAMGTPNPGGEKGLQPLSPRDIDDVIDFLLQVEGRPYDRAAAARGGVIYSTRGACYDCHGSDARGDAAIGAPNLADGVWLYGDGSRASLRSAIAYGRQGVCPAWIKVLSPAEIAEAAAYVHVLSHGRAAAKIR